MAKAKGFNKRGRRFTFAVTRGMTRELAEEKQAARRRLAPQYVWAIKQVDDGTYGLGRAVRK